MKKHWKLFAAINILGLIILSLNVLNAQSVSKEKTMESMVLANKYFMEKWPDVGQIIITDKPRPSNIWTRGVYYEGLMALYKLKPDSSYLDYALRWGEFHKWGLRDGIKTRNGDNQCCGQTYIDLYLMNRYKEERIKDIKACIDSTLVTDKIDDWNWIDALQMRKKIFVPALCLIVLLTRCTSEKYGIIMTVNGPIPAREMGITLVHEHILVDFIGADSINEQRWDKTKVFERSLPFLKQIKDLGCRTFIECTPVYLGRDPLLLKNLSSSSGLNILTNKGYYGAGNNKYIPGFAYNETADKIAFRWIMEWENGIEGTGIRPGFIKIGVAGDSLPDLHKKLVIAAARTHLKTGLTIASHTGRAVLAFEELEILRREGVPKHLSGFMPRQKKTRVTLSKPLKWVHGLALMA